MPPGTAGGTSIVRTGLNVMGYYDSDERGHDPTPCSSSVCMRGGTARPESGHARLRAAALTRNPERDAGRLEWLASAKHGQAQDFSSPRTVTRGAT
jgi:hypothetical protein